jgi:hypothetical protein
VRHLGGLQSMVRRSFCSVRLGHGLMRSRCVTVCGHSRDLGGFSQVDCLPSCLISGVPGPVGRFSGGPGRRFDLVRS